MNREKFELEFNASDTIAEKQQIIRDFIESSVDSNTLEVEEFVTECKSKINDILQQESIEQDILINIGIENGNYVLYRCINSIESYKKDSNYYVKALDIADDYRKTGIGETNKLINDLINSIKPIYWIVVDDGIGSLKRKIILPENVDFQKHFSEFV